MADIETDVVIVGAGPTGAAAAWRFARAGVGVVCLARGGWFDYAAIDRDGPAYEARRQGELHANPNLRRFVEDYPVDDSESPIVPMIGNGVGGGSIWWSAHLPRFRPDDFRMRSEDGVGDDWPLSYDDLEPYYALNEEMTGVAFAPGDPTGGPRSGTRKRLPTVGACGRRFAAAFDRLGWHWWPVDLVVGRDADGSDAQDCTHIGPCDLGCQARRRQSADHAYLRGAVAAGARVLTGMRALRIEHDAAGRADAVVCATEFGSARVRASHILLAANGIGTPRLLLMSASGRFPDGLANGSRLVGRNLMLHPYARVDGTFDEPLGAWVSGLKAGLVSFEFAATDRARGFVRGFKLQMVPGPGPLALAAGAATGSPLPWGADHHRAFEERFDRIAGLTVCAEDLAEPDNRVALSDALVDSDGAPAPKMIYRVSENSRACLDFGMDRAEEALREAGARAIHRTPLRREAGFHLMGTARAGADRETSVVDPHGRCHEVDNLHVIDASVFVTSAAINPTATAQAFALRAADHILAQRRA